MTLDEAIKQAEEVVEEMSYEYQECISVQDYIAAEQCGECAQKQNQLAEWLKELRDYRERIPSYEAGYNDAKREIALSGEYERAYERGKADAQPKMGKWIYDKNIENWRCSKCGETPKTPGYCGAADFMVEHFKYCNHCGAKMEVENESTRS